MTPSEILSIDSYKSNAELVMACARLGYLKPDWRTLDPTWGAGTFWKIWKPNDLVACDLVERKSPIGYSVDFTLLPWSDESFDCVVFDPPYKLNGRPDPEIDGRYGVDIRTRWQDRMGLCRAGLRESFRVCGDGFVLMKCKDQVVSGRKRWQTIEFTKEAESCGFGLVDRLDIIKYRPQPDGTSQVHSRGVASTMLIFKRGWWTSDLGAPLDEDSVADMDDEPMEDEGMV